jgi:NADPH:quinone reductase-like Zn-dependent oxidoreductase
MELHEARLQDAACDGLVGWLFSAISRNSTGQTTRTRAPDPTPPNNEEAAMSRAYAIKAEAIAAERARVDDDLDKVDVARVIALDELEVAAVGPGDVRVRILAVSAEHNIAHAALADTVNIADLRGGKIYPGNSAVGEVVEVGPDVTRFKVEDIVLTHCNGEPDALGYPLRIWAYDQPDSVGWYAEEAVVGDWQLVHAPLDCGLDLWEIAALPLRAPTAYHLWRRAEGMLRVKVPQERLATLNVMGFGGGVSELFLMLAKHRGHNAFFCSGSPARREALEAHGIVGIDQKAFNRFAERGDVKAFGKEVKSLTGGTGMHIVCDLLRGPVFEAGIAAASRQGVNVSAGWQLGTMVKYNSAGASTKQLTLDHTHYETLPGIEAATSLYGAVFKPTIHSEIYAFEDLPRAMAEMQANQQTGIPIIRVADDMPEAVRGLIP